MAADNTVNISVAKRFKRVYDALEKEGLVKNKAHFAERLHTAPPNITGIFLVAKPEPKTPPAKGKKAKAPKVAARYPTLKMIHLLTKLYKVNAHWLITGKGDMFV